MLVALDTGGSQAALLEAVSRRLRERGAVAREIRVAATSARLSAGVIAATPAAFAVVVLAVDPSVVSAALQSPIGQISLVLGLALELVGAVWMRRLVDARSRAAVEAEDGVAEVADLFSLALGAGLTTVDALATIAPRVDGRAGRTLRVSVARLAAGDRFVDELARWSADDALGADARPLAGALVAAHRDGAPAVDALDQLAADLRHAQRQRVNERVQRLPVVLLFPLVGCILPAFVLVAVMPVAVGSLVSMRTG
jgi:tight adherence protein B